MDSDKRLGFVCLFVYPSISLSLPSGHPSGELFHFLGLSSQVGFCLLRAIPRERSRQQCPYSLSEVKKKKKKKKTYNFEEVQLTSFSFMGCAFGVKFNSLFLVLDPENCLLVFILMRFFF